MWSLLLIIRARRWHFPFALCVWDLTTRMIRKTFFQASQNPTVHLATPLPQFEANLIKIYKVRPGYLATTPLPWAAQRGAPWFAPS